jgi:hypothetical protein
MRSVPMRIPMFARKTFVNSRSPSFLATTKRINQREIICREMPNMNMLKKAIQTPPC